MNADTAIHIVPYGDDPLRLLVSLLLDHHRDRLPDLTRPVVLLPHPGVVPRFRRMLRQQAAQLGHRAVLPPSTDTLVSWAIRFADKKKRRLSAAGREILLRNLLDDFPAWRDQFSVWPLIDSLLVLFDEMTMNRCRLPDDLAGFARQVTITGSADFDELSPLGNEARLVHVLWNAWRQRLTTLNLQDQSHQAVDGLARGLEQAPADTRIYVAGFSDFTRAEIECLKAWHAQGRLTMLVHGGHDSNRPGSDDATGYLLHEMGESPAMPATSNHYERFLNNAYAKNDGQLLERAHRQKELSPTSPAHGRLIIHEAADAESEARAIEIQVRRWLLQGFRDIGIVTNDRKLARRARALLERADIALQDAGGWVLSTTSAATALARWLECAEQYFSHKPLLDLLKSPFLQLGFGRTELDRLVPAFEQTIVRARNIASGLDNYRAGLNRASDELRVNFSPDLPEALAQMLDRLENAADALTRLISTRSHQATDFLEALLNSLKSLELFAGLENDDAGRELLNVIGEMKLAATHGGLRLTWLEFRQWLMRNMEQRRFHPRMKGSGIELMSFAESRLYRCDAIIIAGALREHMPGPINAPLYFNDSVRAELGLPALSRRYAILFQDFRRLLEAAPRVMITLRRESDNERLVPSPWVEQLRAFHDLAYHEPLTDFELEWLVQQPAAVIANRETPLPVPVAQPAARLPTARQPLSVTATDHQRLIDCPYQFFCAAGLGLKPDKDVRDEMEKMDFGVYIHRILQAFHMGLPNLPGPWRKTLNDETLPEAEALLREISQKVFAYDLRRRFVTRGWLHRWESCIPAYLDWQLKHSRRWQVQAVECKKQRDYHATDVDFSVNGRIDRLDYGAEGYCVIDYKTGAVPSRDLVIQGEKIQLPFYSLLLEEENIARAFFLSIQDGKVSEKTVLDGETLAILRQAMRERLTLLKRQLDGETPLPAWGDPETCRLCDMEGLCRREMWIGPIRSAQ